MSNIIFEEVFEELTNVIDKHTPEGSQGAALWGQWLQSIAIGGELYCNREIEDCSKLKKLVIQELRKNNLYKNKIQFYNLIFDKVIFKPIPNNKFTFIDLFAGIGGLRLAAQNNGGACVFSSEFDSFAQDTYKRNYGDIPFGDITKINEVNIPEHDLLLAGFPCQPFSYAGKTLGFEDKTRGTLFFDVLRILEAKKPKVALLENVKGFKSHDKGNTMYVALNALNEAGYYAYWTILNSYDYNVPQYRERWYCVAIRKDIDTGDFEFPNNRDRTTTLRNIIDFDLDDKTLNLTKFEIERIEHHFANYKTNERVEHDSSKYAPNTKKGKYGVFSYLKPDGSLRFHVGDFSKTQIQEAFYACLDTYAPTIIANRVPKLWDIKRKLSVKEACRLQGFPEKFDFNVSKGQAYKQLGNSVTVPVIDAIISQILRVKGF